MTRIVTWFLSTVTIVVLLFGYHTSTSGALVTSPGVVLPTRLNPGSGDTSSHRPVTVTGPVVQTQWGPVQVEVTTEGSKITDVKVLQYPSGNSRDEQINAYALPILVQATLDSQSANIDMVSGATYTSSGYLQSLQAALDEARP